MFPRFSILVPTRSGVEVLPGCLDSILADPGEDIEVVVSDNANDDGTKDLLERYSGDPRVRILRQVALLDVTQNWNATLAASRGDYVLMMGDDDLLLPGFFTVVRDALRRGQAPPDALSFEAWMYAAPGTAPDLATGLYGTPWTKTRHLANGGAFQPATRRAILQELFALRQPMALTMQTTLVSRHFIDLLAGPLFVAPFPDWYAYAALCVRAEDWRYLPHRCAVIGISRGSFSQAFNQADYQTGFSYLGFGLDQADPGAEMLEAVLGWLSVVRGTFANELGGLDIDRGEYVVRRVWNWIKQQRRGDLSAGAVVRRIAALPPGDQRALVLAASRPKNLARAARVAGSATNYGAHPWWRDFRPTAAADGVQFVKHLQRNGELDPLLGFPSP